MMTRNDAVRRWTALCGAGVLLGAVALAGCDFDDSQDACPVAQQGPDGDPEDLIYELPASCAFQCGDCPEPEQPYDCPAMRPWSQVPHAAACGCFDGQAPAVTEGACSATAVQADALRQAGPQGGQRWVLPNGHQVTPAGRYASLDESDLVGTFPMTLLPIEGTSLLLSSDGGIKDNVLRLLDPTALLVGGATSAAHVRFDRPSSLFHGLAWLAPDTALASGGGDGFVYVFAVDTVARTMVRDEARDIDLGGPTSASFGDARWYSGPLATALASTRLFVGPSVAASDIQVRSLEPASWGQSLGSVAIGGESVFDIALDPFDPQEGTLYATVWDSGTLAEIDASSMKVSRTLDVGKNPEGMAFLDGSHMVVASSDLDRLVVVDRGSMQATSSVELVEPGQPYGQGPSSLAYDPPRGRLYATLSAVNAVAVFNVVTSGGDASLVAAGRISTGWWPTAVSVLADGSLVILSGKGTGTGADAGSYEWNDGPITKLMHGGVQYVPVSDLADLSALSDAAEAGRKLAEAPGYPTVSCPAGSDYDFPVPPSPAEGPSAQIEHIVFIVRENKTYDAVLGDLAGADGDPSLVLAPGQMDAVFPNIHRLATGFTNFDNFYTDAEQSVQGHVWTAFGRTTDFIERAWLTAWGRGTRAPTAGISEQGSPVEGSLFKALDRVGVPYANMGEIIGVGDSAPDPHYPGLYTAIGKPDLDKACYLAIHTRALCDLRALTYMTLPNDHTLGGDALAPHPGVMIAVNDEATGRVIDAVSHSPLWPRSLVIVTEDDPQNGADHVEVHRTVLVMASPWIKRGYVSRGHYDMASVHKLIVTVLGVPYPNEEVAQAALPYDAFTSTPDFTPYEFTPRSYDQPCNPAKTNAAAAAKGWDFEQVDEQPGIQYWIWRILHDGRYD